MHIAVMYVTLNLSNIGGTIMVGKMVKLSLKISVMCTSEWRKKWYFSETRLYGRFLENINFVGRFGGKAKNRLFRQKSAFWENKIYLFQFFLKKKQNLLGQKMGIFRENRLFRRTN